MKKFMRKIAAIILCMCMLVPMVPEVVLADSVSETEIAEVRVTIDKPLVGNGEQTIVCSVADDAGYTIITSEGNDKWLDPSGAIGQEFIEGNDYRAAFKVTAKSGYKLTENTKVYVNDSTEGVHLLGGNGIDNIPNPASVFEFVTKVEEPTIISTIELTDVPTEAEIGTIPTEYSYENTQFSARGTWHKYDDSLGGYVPMEQTEQFVDGEFYVLPVKIDLKNGYQFDIQNTQMTINGELMPLEDVRLYTVDCPLYFGNAEAIDVVEISSESLPKAEIGNTFTNTEIEVPVAEGSPYTVKGAWEFIDENGILHREGTFEKGKSYNFSLFLTPKAGYSFVTDLEIRVGDELEWIRVRDPKHVHHIIKSSLKDVVDTVTLLNLPIAVVGEPIQAGEFAVEVPENAPYTAVADWYINDVSVDSSMTGMKFEKGNRYNLEVHIFPKSGYEFDEYIIVNAYGIDVKKSTQIDGCLFIKEFSFLTEISSVEITGYTEPKVGDDVSTNLATLKAPADANYEIAKAEWLDYESAEAVTTFEKGKNYALNIYIVPKEGYEFKRSTVVTLNGNKVRVDFTDAEPRVVENVSFKELITEVQLSNVPSMEIGKTAVTDVKVPDGAKYTVDVSWRAWDDTKAKWIDFSGTFETGKVYKMDVFVLPKDGYRFSEDATTFKVDSNKYDDADIRSDKILFEKLFQTEHKVIERIELTIEEPVVGNHASIAPVITIVGNANYSIIEDFVHWLSGSEDDIYPYDEYFVADGTYGVNFLLRADVGYVFSDDLVIVINGKVLPEDAYDILSKEMFVNYFYGMGTDEEMMNGAFGGSGETAGGTNDEMSGEAGGVKSPATSDAFDTVMYVGLLFVSMFIASGVFVSRGRKWTPVMWNQTSHTKY